MVKKLEYGAKQIIKSYLEALKSAHGQLDLQALLHLQTLIDTLKSKKRVLQELYAEGLIDYRFSDKRAPSLTSRKNPLKSASLNLKTDKATSWDI